MKIIIAGSRDILDIEVVNKAMELSGFGLESISQIVSGTASGVDTLGEQWAKERGIYIASMPAKWIVNGVLNRNAGFDRNVQMGEYADAAVCVWNGKSNGTKHMIKTMKKLNKPCYVHHINFIDLFAL